MEPGTLFIIATPIGNLADITFRAVETLKIADVIACEDTRVTRRLLDRYGIAGKHLIAHHARNEAVGIPGILNLLEQGKNVALVSDAGTPVISDPGNRLAGETAAAGFNIVPIPGPSALTALLSITHFRADRFVFEGFLPNKKGRKTRLDKLTAHEYAVVIYESSHRILKLLDELSLRCPEREIIIGRELTKIHETVFRGAVREARIFFETRSVKGEFVLVLAGFVSGKSE